MVKMFDPTGKSRSLLGKGSAKCALCRECSICKKVCKPLFSKIIDGKEVFVCTGCKKELKND